MAPKVVPKVLLQLKELTEAFALFDTDGSGYISVEELGNLLRSIGQDLSAAELAELVDEVDSNQTDTIEFKEFVRVVEGKGKRASGKSFHKELLDAFKLYDKSGDGKITAEELREALKSVGNDLSEKEVGAAIKKADVDGDGHVTYSEFLKLLTATRP